MNVVSFSMPSLPSLKISFDDRNFVTYYNDYESSPAKKIAPTIPPLSPIRRPRK